MPGEGGLTLKDTKQGYWEAHEDKRWNLTVVVSSDFEERESDESDGGNDGEGSDEFQK